MIRNLLVLALATLLVAAVGGTSRAHAAGGTFHVTATGNQDWGPVSGAIDQISDEQLSVSGTEVDVSRAGGAIGVDGTADYQLQSGPGIVRAQIDGSWTVPSGDAYPFNPSLQAVSTTELTVHAPDDTFVNASVNIHVDGFLYAPVCGGRPDCGTESVTIQAGPFTRVAEFNSLGQTRANDFGLTLEPVPGGYHVHGEVTSSVIGFHTNTPVPVFIVLNLSGRFGGSPVPSTVHADFDDPLARYQVSFSTDGPVLNGIPAGYTVSGPSVVDNHWTDPFGPPPPANVVVTNCADPALAGLTTVNGSLIFRNVPGCPAIALPQLEAVHGDLIIENNPALGHISIPGPVVVDGSIRIVGNTVGSAIDVGTAGGDLTIDANTAGGPIDVGGSGGDLTITNNSATVIDAVGGQVGGDATIVDNGTTLVDANDTTEISGDLELSTEAPSTSAVTADGTTTITMLNGAASLHAVLPAGAFDAPVPFTVDYRPGDPSETGTAGDGTTAVVDPLGTYRFTFDVPTLSSAATLSFTVDMAQLAAADRATLLAALGSGTATIYGKGDAPGSTPAAFPVCTASQTPGADHCAAISLLAADGTPTTGNPAFVRFDGVVGHFSSYGVAVVTKAQHDTTAPVVTVPADIVVDATDPAGARVTYAASAHDDSDPAPALVCAPASGTTFAIGTTRVTCTARDASGNVGAGTFSVRVRGASEQIVRLIDKTILYLDQPALRPLVKAELQAAADELVAKRPKTACLALDLYVLAVRLAPAKAFTPAERNELVADAMRIRSVLGCK